METCTKADSIESMSHPPIVRETDIVIVGAGPYGLSVAAHLKAHNVDFLIFGNPMYTWREQMPKGMFLKSDGFASSLSDPTHAFTLEHFCAEKGIAYDHTRVPVSLDTFCAYGTEFQKRFVPKLENKLVTEVEREPDGMFHVTLDTGEKVIARTVVMAIGITHYKYVPEDLARMPEKFLTHSSDHSDLSEFRGKEVAVIGAGASAADVAAILNECGAKTTLIARHRIRFHNPPSEKPRSLWQRMKAPSSGIGPGWKSRLFSDLPVMFHRLPEGFRLKTVKTHLGPAPGWVVKDKVVGKLPVLEGYTPERAEIRNGKVELLLRASDGSTKTIMADHVIAATGYRVDLRRLKFIGKSICNNIESIEQSPVLSATFESSIPGLFFLGVSAANSFGPLMRFAFGSEFAARQITPRLLKRSSQPRR